MRDRRKAPWKSLMQGYVIMNGKRDSIAEWLVRAGSAVLAFGVVLVFIKLVVELANWFGWGILAAGIVMLLLGLVLRRG